MNEPFSFDVTCRERVTELASRDWLQREYADNVRSTTDIARQLGCAHSSVVRALARHGIIARSAGRRARGIERAFSETAREFAQIVDEMVACLQQDRVNHPPSWSFVGRRFKVVTDAALEDGECWAQRMALIELASAAMLVADSKTPKRP